MKKDQFKFILEIALAAVLAIFITVLGSCFATSREHEDKKDPVKGSSSKKSISHDYVAILKTHQ